MSRQQVLISERVKALQKMKEAAIEEAKRLRKEREKEEEAQKAEPSQ